MCRQQYSETESITEQQTGSKTNLLQRAFEGEVCLTFNSCWVTSAASFVSLLFSSPVQCYLVTWLVVSRTV